MSYAIIRNANYKRDNLPELYKHNERKNTNYSNKDINKNNSINNYSIKQCNTTYSKVIKQLINENDLKCRITSYTNLVCEFIITSDKEFFETIGEEETKRYFQTAYNFVANYNNLGEDFIVSAKVHMDESTPHLHLVFVPVVRKLENKSGKTVNKIACSEFWKVKDSYRQLQNAFYDYMVSHNFELERGLPKEETGREHLDLKEYKEITNFEKTKETLKNIKLELPDVPEIADISRFSIKRDEKILEEIIKPKDELIQGLYQDNLILHQELSRQAKVIDEAEKYQKERDTIISDNKALNNKIKDLEREYKNKINNLDFDYSNRKDELEKEFKTKEFDIEYKYKHKIKTLEKENSHLHKIVDKFYETVEKFIKWICHKFGIGESKELVKKFEEDTNTLIDPEKQLKKEEREKEWDLEL